MTEYEEQILRIEQEKLSLMKSISSHLDKIAVALLFVFFSSCASCTHIDDAAVSLSKISRHLDDIEGKMRP